MNGLSITVSDDGATYVVAPFSGGLHELQAVVGGTVEVIPSDPGVTMWVADEGKYVRPVPNRLAMDVWIRWDIHGCMMLGGDWLAGNVVVTGGVDAYGETRDITDAARAWVLRVARDAGATIHHDWSVFGLVDDEDDA